MNNKHEILTRVFYAVSLRPLQERQRLSAKGSARREGLKRRNCTLHPLGFLPQSTPRDNCSPVADFSFAR